MRRILVLSSQAFSLLHYRLDMMKYFISLGYEVYAAAPDKEPCWAEELIKSGIAYRSFDMERNGENPIRDIQGYFSLKKLIRNVGPDIVFAYQAKTVIYGSLAARSCGVKKVYALIAGLGSAFRSDDADFKKRLVRRVLCVEYKAALRRADLVFFHNKDDSGAFLDKGLVRQSQIRHMNGSGANMELFRHSAVPRADGAAKTVLFVGRYIRDKGLAEYLDAARLLKKKYPDLIFQIVGYYDTNPSAIKPEEVQPYIDDGSITDCGRQDDVYPFYRDCTVFALPSYHEGTPKSVLEAMAVGRPIVTTDAPGCREPVTDDVNGFLVPVKDSRALADAIEKLICDGVLAERMGEASYEIARDKYDAQKVNRRLAEDMGLTAQE